MAQHGSTIRFCPECSRVGVMRQIAPDEVLCPKCAEIRGPKTTLPPQPQSSNVVLAGSPIKFCPECSRAGVMRQIPPEDQLCPECAAAHDPQPAPEQQPQHQRAAPVRDDAAIVAANKLQASLNAVAFTHEILVMISGVVCALAGMALLVYSVTNSDPDLIGLGAGMFGLGLGGMLWGHVITLLLRAAAGGIRLLSEILATLRS